MFEIFVSPKFSFSLVRWFCFLYFTFFGFLKKNGVKKLWKMQRWRNRILGGNQETVFKSSELCYCGLCRIEMERSVNEFGRVSNDGKREEDEMKLRLVANVMLCMVAYFYFSFCLLASLHSFVFLFIIFFWGGAQSSRMARVYRTLTDWREQKNWSCVWANILLLWDLLQVRQ